MELMPDQEESEAMSGPRVRAGKESGCVSVGSWETTLGL